MRLSLVPCACACVCVCLGLPPVVGLAAELQPSLLGSSTSAAAVTTTMEELRMHALTPGGSHVILTASTDRWLAGDHNGALDVMVLDCVTGARHLVSQALSAESGNGASYAAGLDQAATRVAFVSRASNLVAHDTNATWDVFVHDPTVRSNRLASVSSTGDPASRASLDPWLSANGRHLVFRSASRELASPTFLGGENLFRHDLTVGETKCLTAPPAGVLPPAARLAEFAVTPDGNGLVLSAHVTGVSSGPGLIAQLEIPSGGWTLCSTQLPPGLTSGGIAVAFRSPAMSANGRRVAFRTDGGLDARTKLHGLCYRDLDAGITTLLSLRTNVPTVQVFPDEAFRAVLSLDGNFVAYSAPSPYDPDLPSANRTNGPCQVHLWDAQRRTNVLVSAATDAFTPANADAVFPQISADGQFVAFLSHADNLHPEAAGSAWRVYWWSADTRKIELAGALAKVTTPSGALTPFAGSRFAFLGQSEPQGETAVFVVQTETGEIVRVPLAPLATDSASGPGWPGIQPAGVSFDGGLLALTALPGDARQTGDAMQAFLVDTRSGTRRRISQDSGGGPASAHVSAPSLSTDGARLLYVSAASNLVSGDVNRVADVFVETPASGERLLIRNDTIPADAPALPECVISPDGAYALVRFVQQTKVVSRLARLQDGALSPPFAATIHGQPSFARQGHTFAVSLGVNLSGADARIEVHDAEAWFAGTDPVPLWVSLISAREPVLSHDGRRVAYFNVSGIGTNAVVVADWSARQVLFSHRLDRKVPSSLGLSADGRYVTWIAPGTGTNTSTQAWRADVNTGTIQLASISVDGTAEGNGNSKDAVLSADGRYVAFASVADNLVGDDQNSSKDVFLRDMETGSTLLVSRRPDGVPGAGWSMRPFFSPDGRRLFFLSHAPDLAAADLNDASDLFKVEILEGSGDLLVVIQRNLSGGKPRLQWNVQPGARYRIEFKDVVDAGAWEGLPGEFSGQEPVEVDSAAAQHRFFRVQELPGGR